MLYDMHQPVVDRHYGAGNFSHGVMPGLQDECDRLGHRIMDSWRQDRNVRRRLDRCRHIALQAPAMDAKTQHSTFKASFGAPARTASPAAGSTANIAPSTSPLVPTAAKWIASSQSSLPCRPDGASTAAFCRAG